MQLTITRNQRLLARLDSISETHFLLSSSTLILSHTGNVEVTSMLHYEPSDTSTFKLWLETDTATKVGIVNISFSFLLELCSYYIIDNTMLGPKLHFCHWSTNRIVFVNSNSRFFWTCTFEKDWHRNFPFKHCWYSEPKLFLTRTSCKGSGLFLKLRPVYMCFTILTFCAESSRFSTSNSLKWE